MSGFDLLRYGRRSVAALALALPLAPVPFMVSAPALGQSVACIPTVDRATARGDSLHTVVDVTLAQYGLSDEQMAAIVRELAAARQCSPPTTTPQPVSFRQSEPIIDPRLAY